MNKIAVTGANGMMGSHMISLLKSKSISTKAVTRKEWDLTKWKSLDELDHIFESVSVIFHFAAQLSYNFSKNNNQQTQKIFDTNIRSCLNLAEWAKLRKIPIVFLSSSVVYKNPHASKIIETDPKVVNGFGGFYGYSKLMAESIINHFVADTDNEMKTLQDECKSIGIEAIPCYHWAKGGEGTIDLANKIVDLCDSPQNFKLLYKDDISLFDKIKTIATEIYNADEIIANSKIRDQLRLFEKNGYGHFPICIAKTQYSFSTDPSLKGAPSNHSIPIREVRLSSGAEFIVVICGEVMTMPGLPSVPAANSIRLNIKGEIEGLF